MYRRTLHWSCSFLYVLCILCAGCASTTAAPTPSTTADAAGDGFRLFRLGQEHAQRGDNLRAEQYLLAAERAGHPTAELLPHLLDVCLSSGRLRSALGYAEPHLRRHPEDYRLRHLVASVHYGLGNATRAFREGQRVLSEAPHHAPSHYLLALISDEAFTDHESARAHFQGYLALEPQGDHAAEASSWLREHPKQKPYPAQGGTNAHLAAGGGS
jgi:tetratricopeptide (TPR) repeat protein